jgi:hypothetical protein
LEMREWVDSVEFVMRQQRSAAGVNDQNVDQLVRRKKAKREKKRKFSWRPFFFFFNLSSVDSCNASGFEESRESVSGCPC